MFQCTRNPRCMWLQPTHIAKKSIVWMSTSTVVLPLVRIIYSLELFQHTTKLNWTAKCCFILWLMDCCSWIVFWNISTESTTTDQFFTRMTSHFNEKWADIIRASSLSTSEHVEEFQNIIARSTSGIVGDGNHRLLLVKKFCRDLLVIPTTVIFPTSTLDLLCMVFGILQQYFVCITTRGFLIIWSRLCLFVQRQTGHTEQNFQQIHIVTCISQVGNAKYFNYAFCRLMLCRCDHMKVFIVRNIKNLFLNTCVLVFGRKIDYWASLKKVVCERKWVLSVLLEVCNTIR